MQRSHQQIVFAVDCLLAQAQRRLLDDRAYACGSEDAAETRAACADHLSHGALGNQDDFQCAFLHVLCCNFGVQTDVSCDELLDLVIVDELSYAVVILAERTAGHGSVVADHCQVLLAALCQSVDELMSVAAAHEAAEHYGSAVRDFGNSLFNRDNLTHLLIPPNK